MTQPDHAGAPDPVPAPADTAAPSPSTTGGVTLEFLHDAVKTLAMHCGFWGTLENLVSEAKEKGLL